jgi:hypothetical protein
MICKMPWFDDNEIEYEITFVYVPAEPWIVGPTTISPPDPAILEILTIQNVNTKEFRKIPDGDEGNRLTQLCYDYAEDHEDDYNEPEDDDDRY